MDRRIALPCYDLVRTRLFPLSSCLCVAKLSSETCPRCLLATQTESSLFLSPSGHASWCSSLQFLQKDYLYYYMDRIPTVVPPHFSQTCTLYHCRTSFTFGYTNTQATLFCVVSFLCLSSFYTKTSTVPINDYTFWSFKWDQVLHVLSIGASSMAYHSCCVKSDASQSMPRLLGYQKSNFGKDCDDGLYLPYHQDLGLSIRHF